MKHSVVFHRWTAVAAHGRAATVRIAMRPTDAPELAVTGLPVGTG